jgi:GTP-binding protein
MKLLEAYLLNRAALRLSLVILDARRGWMPQDLEWKHWLEAHHRQYLVIATKMDKLNQSDAQRNLNAIRKENAEPLACSASTGRGVRELWQAIAKTHHSSR